ncbi:hypothetical protein FXB41_07085 [Bradyrhizobium canariense]|uniref:hypothetical protein n=1 Tax=Bradyrhizobium canariense TaxID=255045 RepID=UPI001CA47031|nr:hypothetical protein [Bradyrhizobium canariense]MBW5434549.1 hypothetical protein [Bradyrhizobium canariense]
MQTCPILTLAQKYDALAKRWLENEDDHTYDKLHYLVLTADQLSPRSITGAAFQIACALSEMDATMGEPASPVRLASERRVMRLLRSVLIFLEQRSADLPSAWKFVVPSGEKALLRKYGSN